MRKWIGALILVSSIACDLKPSYLNPPELQHPSSGAAYWSLDTIQFSWKTDDSASYYELQIAKQSSFSPNSIVLSEHVLNVPYTWNIDGSVASRLFWRVRLIHDTAEGEWSQSRVLYVLPYVVKNLATQRFPRVVRITNNKLYVLEDSTFEVFDLQDPVTPQKIGELTFNGVPFDLEVQGNYAYIAAGTQGGIYVIDIQNPHQPNIVANYDSVFYAQDLAVQDSLLVVAEASHGFTVLSVSTPSQPRFIATIPSANGYYTNIYHVLFVQGFLYATDGYYLQVFDMTDPANPSVTAQIGQLGYGISFDQYYNYLYILHPDLGGAAVRLADISNPANPTEIGAWKIIHYPDQPKDIAVFNNQLLIATQDRGLIVWDISDPFHPQALGINPSLTQSTSVRARNGYAYISEGTQGIAVVKIQK